MLRRVRITGYKSLRDLELELRPLSVLFGPNASGKSNLLDALQLVSRIATCRTLNEAFAAPYRGKPLESFAFGPEGLPGLLRSERRTFVIEVDVQLSDRVVEAVERRIAEMTRSSGGARQAQGQGRGTRGARTVRERRLRYRIEVEVLPRSGILRVAEEYLAALNRAGEPTRRRKPFLERVGERLHLRPERQGHPSYYDCHLDHSVLSLPHYTPHHPHVAAMRQELESWLFFYFEPRERMRAANPVKEVRHIGLMGEELAAYLNTLKETAPRQFAALEEAVKAVLPQIEGIDVTVNNLGEVELALVEDGIPIPARVVSEGTLRILGLLALAGVSEPAALIGFEEPENGVHPRRIRLIADLLKTRTSLGTTQYIVTTHSPLLPNLLPDESLYVCRRVGGATRIEPFSCWGPLGKKPEISQVLDDEELEELTISERILRGDFGG